MNPSLSDRAPAVRAPAGPDALAHSFDEADAADTDLRRYGVEDWVCLAFFWAMCALVFLQFFTRYVLNDSFAWTEELASYTLLPVVFVGAAACVRRSRHIQVNFLYRYLPHGAGRAASTLVDVVSVVFFAWVAWLIARFALMMDTEPMTTIDWKKSHVYWLAFAGMAAMALRALQAAWRHWRQGYSVLERPEAWDDVSG